MPEASFTLPNQKRYNQLISYTSKLLSLFLKALLFSVNCEPLFHRYVYHYGYYCPQLPGDASADAEVDELDELVPCFDFIIFQQQT